MLWFKHIAKSKSDPDIVSGIMRYGSDAYFVFFNTLEVLSIEDCVDMPLEMDFNAFHSFFPRVSKRRLAEILMFYASDERQKPRFYLRKNNKKNIFFDENFCIYCYKLHDLSSTYAKNVRTKIKTDLSLRRKKKEDLDSYSKTTKKAPVKKGKKKIAKRKAKKPAKLMPFKINGQPIPESFHYYLIKNYSDWAARRFYYRARNSKNVIAYIRGGLKDKDGTVGYIKQAKADESDNPKKVNRWIIENIDLVKPVKKPRGAVEIFKITEPESVGKIIDDMNINKGDK